MGKRVASLFAVLGWGLGLSFGAPSAAHAQGSSTPERAEVSPCVEAPWEFAADETCDSGEFVDHERDESPPESHAHDAASAPALPDPEFDERTEPEESDSFWRRVGAEVTLGGGALWVDSAMAASPSTPPSDVDESQLGPWRCREGRPACTVRVERAGLVPFPLLGASLSLRVAPRTRLSLGVRMHLGEDLAMERRSLLRVDVEQLFIDEGEWHAGCLLGWGFGSLAARPPQRELVDGPYVTAGRSVASLGLVVLRDTGVGFHPHLSLRVQAALPQFAWGSELALGVRWGTI